MADERVARERVDEYLATINRLEPDIHPADAVAFYASAAISLKRIADAAEKIAATIATPTLVIGPANLLDGLNIDTRSTPGIVTITRKL